MDRRDTSRSKLPILSFRRPHAQHAQNDPHGAHPSPLKRSNAHVSACPHHASHANMHGWLVERPLGVCAHTSLSLSLFLSTCQGSAPRDAHPRPKSPPPAAPSGRITLHGPYAQWLSFGLIEVARGGHHKPRKTMPRGRPKLRPYTPRWESKKGKL